MFLFLEIISTISGIACVYFQTREKIIAWPFGILSVSLAVFIFYREMLYSDFILHSIYIILNIYGWYYWSKVKRKAHSKVKILEIQSISRFQIIWWLIIIFSVTGMWGYFMHKNFNASFPYLDAFTTAGSLVAQYLLARKVLQNWLIWIAVDLVAIGVYLAKDLYFFSALFMVYLLLCIKGYFDWRKPVADHL